MSILNFYIYRGNNDWNVREFSFFNQVVPGLAQQTST